MHDLQAGSNAPMYGNYDVDGQTITMDGSADDLLWLWPQDMNADFINTGNDMV